MALARFGFKNLARDSVDRFSSHDGLLFPRERVVDHVLERKVTAKKWLVQLRRCELANCSRRTKEGPAHLVARAAKKNRFALALLGKENLIENFRAAARSARFDLNLERRR